MKTPVPYLFASLLIVGALSPARAQEPAPATPQAGLRRLDKPAGRVFAAEREGARREMETVTYLGVVTTPVSPTLSAQLGLPKDVGLVVNNVAPDSPAASALKEHDILTKLDDQILIDVRQLTVLVRSHKDGDEVTLTLRRGGKEMTVKVKLAKHEVPKMAFDLPGMPGSGFPGLRVFNGQPFPNLPGMGRDDVDRVMRLMQEERGQPNRSVRSIIEHNRVPGDDRSATIINLPRSNVVFSDDDGVLELNLHDGQRLLTAKNAKGEVLFNGPINTDAERSKVPAAIRIRLDKLEKMDGFRFEVREGFQQEGGAVPPPENRQRIVLPRGSRPLANDPAARPF